MTTIKSASPQHTKFVTITLGIIATVYFASIFTRQIVNDDYMAIYTAWLKGLGQIGGKDFNLDSYSIIMDLLVPIVMIFPDGLGSLYAARLIYFILIGIVAFLIYRLGTLLFNARVGIWSVILVLITTPMVARGLDLRPDMIICIGWLGLFTLFIDKDNFFKPAKLLLASFLLILVTACKFKAIIVAGPIGLLFLYHGATDPNKKLQDTLKSVLIILTSCILFLSLYFALVYFTDDINIFLTVNQSLLSGISNGSVSDGSARLKVLVEAVILNPIFILLVLFGLIRWFKNRSHVSQQHRVLVFMLLLCAVLSVALNPAYFAYNLTILFPMLGIFAGLQMVALQDRWKESPLSIGKRKAALITIGILLLLLKGPLVIRACSLMFVSHQMALQDFIEHHINEDEAIFGFEGLGLFRPSTYHWRTSSTLNQYQDRYSLKEEMMAAKPVLVVTSYRVPDWLIPEDQQFLLEHYQEIGARLMTPGFAMKKANQVATGYLLVDSLYLITNSEKKSCRIDDKSVPHGTKLNLPAQTHYLHAIQGLCTVKKYYSEAALQKLVDSNPLDLPYLVGPTTI